MDMAPAIRITVKNCLLDETKNVNDWFTPSMDELIKDIGKRNFSAWIQNNQLTVFWEHPFNPELVHKLVIPVLKVIKQRITESPNGRIDSSIELNDYSAILEVLPSTELKYPYSYIILKLNIDLDCLEFKPRYMTEE